MRDERGQNVFELALSTFIMVFLIFGITEYGRLFYLYHILLKSVRDGARYIASHPYRDDADPNNYITKAKNLVVYGNTAGVGAPVVSGLTTSNVVISTIPPGITPGLTAKPDFVTVSITNYTIQSLFPAIVDLSITLTNKPQVTLPYMQNTR